MTRRHPWTRLLAALVAAWFAAIGGEPRWLHACAMHDGAHAPAAAEAAPVADAHAGHGAHAAPTEAAPSDAAPADAPPDHEAAPHVCTCLGECATAAPAALPTIAAVPVAAVGASLQATAIAGAAHRPVAPDFFLPFANGPPTAAVVAA